LPSAWLISAVSRVGRKGLVLEGPRIGPSKDDERVIQQAIDLMEDYEDMIKAAETRAEQIQIFDAGSTRSSSRSSLSRTTAKSPTASRRPWFE
jgi:hypothetical protein